MRLLKQYTPAELAQLFKQAASGPVPGFNAPPVYAKEAERGQEQETALYNASADTFVRYHQSKQPIIEADFEEID